MAEPKKRLTSTRSGKRQSHNALESNVLVNCSHCKQKIRPHKVCENCGYYRGKKITETIEEIKKTKKVEKELKNE